MVLCVIGLVLFGILGIFSGKYRRYFRGSLHCLRRQLMLKPCDTEFDQEMKAKITGALSKRSEKSARFVFRRFALLSWIFVILFVFSIAAIAVGAFNFVAYGNCNGQESSDFCILGLLSGSVQDKIASLKPVAAGNSPAIGNTNASVKIVEVGCFSCPYTREAESVRGQILEKYGDNASFAFHVMPLPRHNLSRQTAEAAFCADEQGRYWDYHDKLFEYQPNMSIDIIRNIAVELSLDVTSFDNCFDSGKYANRVEKSYQEGLAAGIFATPTYFVNEKPVVGLKAFADLEKIVVGEIYGSCPAVEGLGEIHESE